MRDAIRLGRDQLRLVLQRLHKGRRALAQAREKRVPLGPLPFPLRDSSRSTVSRRPSPPPLLCEDSADILGEGYSATKIVVLAAAGVNAPRRLAKVAG